ncbi:MAG TPA: nucleotidyltransferase [Chthoniobacterales bacterium]
MANGPHDPETGELIPREPSLEDLVALCRELNARDAAYVVVGGFAIRAAGYSRNTQDVDLVIDATLENEAKVFAALATLPDGCVRELEAGEVGRYVVVRVADEILVDLMAKASGIDFAEASRSVTVHEIDGVAVPFASPELLWRMKRRANREKDRGDIQFLRMWFEARGLTPPED